MNMGKRWPPSGFLVMKGGLQAKNMTRRFFWSAISLAVDFPGGAHLEPTVGFANKQPDKATCAVAMSGVQAHSNAKNATPPSVPRAGTDCGTMEQAGGFGSKTEAVGKSTMAHI
ncbi:hypothetical protein U1Q18_009796 [Sarracenia purpurea var. burkii]